MEWRRCGSHHGRQQALVAEGARFDGVSVHMAEALGSLRHGGRHRELQCMGRGRAERRQRVELEVKA
jgi:hypothetical protein